MNIFSGTLFRTSQTDTLLQPIAIANLDTSAKNASSGDSWNNTFGTLAMGRDMRVMKEKSTWFVPPEFE